MQFACQSHLWKLGDFQLKQGNFLLAARWYRHTTASVFSTLADTNGPRSRRKMALCLLRAGQTEEARNLVEKRPSKSASDAYIRFLCAGMQDREAEGEQSAFGQMT
jgi:thioredoxin-like negative regulator of GroEL